MPNCNIVLREFDTHYRKRRTRRTQATATGLLPPPAGGTAFSWVEPAEALPAGAAEALAAMMEEHREKAVANILTIYSVKKCIRSEKQKSVLLTLNSVKRCLIDT